MRDGGKGDKQRPLSISKSEFDAAWDRIFKEKDGSLTINVDKGESNEYKIIRNDRENLQNDSGSV
jgi:hypothetical protein